MKISKSKKGSELLTFGGHLEVLRRMLFRVCGLAACVALFVFCFKEETFKLLLAPSEWDFVTYRWIERVIRYCGGGFHFEEFHVDLIATELSSQFMTHVTTAIYLGLLGASPYIVYELFRFVSPALYENEKTGFPSPYRRVALSAVTVSTAFSMTSELFIHSIS